MAALDTGIDIPDAVEAMTTFLTETLNGTGAEGYVLGVSGGLDSAVVAHLAVEAVGSEAVTGLVMPGEPSDEENMADARELCRSLDITWRTLDIQPVVQAFRAEVPYEMGDVALGNVRARARMVYWYAEANVHDLLVLGGGNKSEHSLGYFTKYGDGGVDLQPMGELYKTEVVDVARQLGVPSQFIEKTPTAGLWEGQTDEGELGASYDTIDRLLYYLLEEDYTVAETAAETGLDRADVERFARMVEDTEHKRSRPPSPSVDRDPR